MVMEMFYILIREWVYTAISILKNLSNNILRVKAFLFKLYPNLKRKKESHSGLSFLPYRTGKSKL